MKTEIAYFAGGCFWCLEASFHLVPGVLEVISGYAGGETDNPTYEEVSSGDTGHAETVEISFDPDMVSYEELLEIFFQLHDPSQENRQGNDIGSQYRSAIFYDSEEQRIKTNNKIKALRGSKLYQEIYTELNPLIKFWRAEDYHQHYFEKHPDQAYCQIIVRPKVEKVRKLIQM